MTKVEAELSDYLEMLVCYMQRQHERDDGALLWELFVEDYPYAAAELTEWINARHKCPNEEVFNAMMDKIIARHAAGKTLP